MKYLSNICIQNGGSCRPLIAPYKDSDGNFRATTNISITSYKGNIITNTRLTNYMYVPLPTHDRISYIPLFNRFGGVTSYNVIGPIDSDKVLHEIISENSFMLGGQSFRGLEDIRLIVWNDILYGVGCRPDIIEGKVITQLVEYNDDFTIKRTWFINTDKRMEKNWQPIEGKPFTFMYDPDKSDLLTLNIDELQEADDINNPTIINEIQTPEFTFVLSGSSQIIRLNDGRYLSICHTSHRYIGNDTYGHWVYNHYFVMYDEDMNKIWVSEPFRFVGDCMEYTCGMCHDDNNLYITFSMFDGITHLLSIPLDNFQNILMNIMENPSIYESEPNIEYMVQCYDSNKIVGPAMFVYAMFLENVHKLDNIDGFDEMLSLPAFSYNDIRNPILLYFITRRTDCGTLINELKYQ